MGRIETHREPASQITAVRYDLGSDLFADFETKN
jgi:hypothetical protein